MFTLNTTTMVATNIMSTQLDVLVLTKISKIQTKGLFYVFFNIQSI